MTELIQWVKAIFAMLTILTAAVLIIMAKVSEIRNLMKGKGGHL